MPTSLRISFLCFLTGLYFLSCNKKDTPDPCQGVNYDVQYVKSEAISTLNNGSISISYPIGDTISYSLNNGSFQASATFSNLSPGNYILTVKNQKGCTDTTNIIILNYGPKYSLVKQIVNGYCGPCHLNTAVSGGKNFDTDLNIINSWDRIKARAVDGIPSFMPPTPNSPLTTVDKQKITDWVNAGHHQSD